MVVRAIHNRTIEELQPEGRVTTSGITTAFNRTSVELKHGRRRWPRLDSDHAFTRTIEEWKLVDSDGSASTNPAYTL